MPEPSLQSRQTGSAVARALLVAMVFLAPIAFVQVTIDNYMVVKLAVFWVLGLVAAAFLVLDRNRPGLPNIRIGWFAGAFLAALVVSTVLSTAHGVSLVGVYTRYGGLLPILLYALVMVLVVILHWRLPDRLVFVAGAIALGASVLALLVLMQGAGVGIKWAHDPTIAAYQRHHPGASMGNSDFAGGWIGISLPFFVLLTLRARATEYRVAFATLGIVALAGLAMTKNRTGVLAGAAGLVAVALAFRRALPRWVSALVTLGVVAGLALMVVLVWHPGMREAPSVLAQHSFFHTRDLEFRTFYWRTAWRIFLSHPLAGTGLDTYYGNYTVHRLVVDGARLGLTELPDKPHNVYLEYAANAGALGAGTYLALVGATLLTARQALRRIEGDLRLMVACFVGAFVAYLTQAFFSIDLPPLALLGWVLIGSIAAIADPGAIRARQTAVAAVSGTARTRREIQAQRRRQPTAPGGVVPALVLGVVALVGLLPLAADVRARDGQNKGRANNFRAAEGAFVDAMKLDPMEATYPFLAGELAERQASAAENPNAKATFFEEAAARYDDALAVVPNHPYYLVARAKVLTQWGDLDANRYADADRAWSVAARHDPNDWEVRMQYGQMLTSWGNVSSDPTVWRKAAVEYANVVRISPLAPSNRRDALAGLGRAELALGEPDQALPVLQQAYALDQSDTDVATLLQRASTGGR